MGDGGSNMHENQNFLASPATQGRETINSLASRWLLLVISQVVSTGILDIEIRKDYCA